MATLREIRGRIVGVRNTSKITQAMKMVAAAKMRRAQDGITAARPYAKEISKLLRHLTGRVDRTTLPLLAERHEVDKILIVIVSADRGLCGGFNTNIIRAATQRIHSTYGEKYQEGKVKLICVGRKAHDFFMKRDYELIGKHLGVFQHLQFSTAQQIVTEIVDGYLNFDYDKVELIYNEFKSIMQQKVVVEEFLPLPIEERVRAEDIHQEHFIEYLYEPSERELMEKLVPHQLNFQMWHALLESNASEQSARMTAMEAATQNALELLRALKLSFNRARQASITKEILEIVAGADALKQS